MKRFASAIDPIPLCVGLGDQAVPDREMIRVRDVVELAQHRGVAQAEVHARRLGDRDEASGRPGAAASRAARACRRAGRRRPRCATRRARSRAPRARAARAPCARSSARAAARTASPRLALPRAVQPGSRRIQTSSTGSSSSTPPRCSAQSPTSTPATLHAASRWVRPATSRRHTRAVWRKASRLPGRSCASKKIEVPQSAQIAAASSGDARSRRRARAPIAQTSVARGRAEPRLHDLDRDRIGSGHGVDGAHEPGVEGRAEVRLRAAASCLRANRAPRRDRVRASIGR